ncbi:MAG: rhamnogalacturonan acetylesterase [Lachnospiraceae bacterium]|nr:rhamnogalacturonan acetylesterase [Lachnospiraceae bacterium]
MSDALEHGPTAYPELDGNFEGTPGKNEGCTSLLVDTAPGNYRVRMTLSPKENAIASEAYVFLGRRMLAACLAATDGIREVSGTVHVGGFIPRGADRVCLGRLAVTLIAPSLQLTSCSFERADLPTIHIAGDSTVTDQPAEHPYRPIANYAGWGQMLPIFLNGSFSVANHAHSGLTTESFRAQGHYDILLRELRAGDYVFFQFAHNDQKLSHLEANGGFRDNLIRYAQEIRARGAHPVLVTPLSRNTWNRESYNDLLRNHAQAVRVLGQEYRIPVLDLHGASMEAIQRAGQTMASRWFHDGDYTHTNDCGAFLAARYIAGAMRDISGYENAYDALARSVDPVALREDSPAAAMFSSILGSRTHRLDAGQSDGQPEEALPRQRDIVPEDLTGPAVWQIDEGGVLKNPDGSPVAPP